MIEHKFFAVKFETGEAGELTGYASTFGGKPDRFGDVIAPGAFAKSLAEHRAAGTAPAFLWQHRTDEPIGTWSELSEDERGLLVKGKLVLDTLRGSEARSLVKSGAVRGLSIGFMTREFERTGFGRILKDVELLEISLATLPANPDAGITDVKTGVDNMDKKTETKPEGTPAPDPAVIDAQIKALETEVKAIGEANKVLETRLNRPKVSAKPKAGEGIEIRAFETFLRKGAEGLQPDEVKALVRVDGPSGGFLAPEEFLSEIDKDLVELSPIRSVARVGTMGAQVVKLPRRTARLTALWTGETDSRTETQPTYGQNSYEAKELGCFVDVSNQLLEDSAVNLVAELSGDFAEEFAVKEGTAFTNGDGVIDPEGFTKATGVTEITTASAGVIVLEDLIDVYHGLKTAYSANGVWMMNRTVMGVVRKIKTTDGVPLLDLQGLDKALNTTILGRPVIEATDLPDIATDALSIWFGDFNRAYRIWDRVGTTIMRDPFTQATTGITRFHARKRVAAGPIRGEALVRMKIQ